MPATSPAVRYEAHPSLIRMRPFATLVVPGLPDPGRIRELVKARGGGASGEGPNRV